MENTPPRNEYQNAVSNNHNKTVKSDIKSEGLDGGYGWVVVFASLMTSLLISGISTSFGVLFVEFLQYFGSNKATTSIIGSLFFSVPLILGPFAGFCVNKWGCRVVCITGSVISGVSLSAAFFAQSLTHLFICFSIAGIGQSFCLLASVVIIPLHFRHRLSLASGLSVCGEGIGSFVFPPLVGLLLEMFAWRGTLLILGGLLLNIAVFGSLMRPPVVTPKGSESQTLANACKSSIQSLHIYKRHSAEIGEEISTIKLSEICNSNHVMNNTRDNGNLVSEDNCSKRGEVGLRNSVCLRRGRLLCIATVLQFKCRERCSTSEQSSFERKEIQPKRKSSGFDIMKSAFFQLFQNAPYGFFCLSNAFLYACGDVPNIYLPDYVNGFGIKMEMASFLLSICGALNTVGVILMGYLGDLPKVNPAILYGCSVCVGGISIACIPLTKIYAVIAICMASHGATISVVSALDIVLLFGLIPEDDFTTAYGLLLLVQGLATLLGSPLAGLVYDLTQSYELPFYGTGALIVISGIIVIFLMKIWNKSLSIQISEKQQ